MFFSGTVKNVLETLTCCKRVFLQLFSSFPNKTFRGGSLIFLEFSGVLVNCNVTFTRFPWRYGNCAFGQSGCAFLLDDQLGQALYNHNNFNIFSSLTLLQVVLQGQKHALSPAHRTS